MASSLPTFDELPKFHDHLGCAWDVWGKDDQLGTVNLLTPEVVERAAKEEIRTGISICLNWPINFPEKPLFNRKGAQINVTADSNRALARDDEITLNSQSGSQWDGLRHFCIFEQRTLYNNTPTTDIPLGLYTCPDPLAVDQQRIKLGIHNWAQHGISGRGVFIDLVRYYEANGSPLPYDPWTTHSVPLSDVLACAKQQGVSFRPCDILIIRMGFIKRYNESTQQEKDILGAKPEEFAGLENTVEARRFLWDNHFAAVASDQPTFESWPAKGPHLHQTILGLWGMPLGEMFDLEALSVHCAKTQKYTFFFSSWPLNILGGCASPPNAAAYF